MDEAIKQILETGILGGLLIVSFGAIFYLYKEVKQSRLDRVTDMKEVWREDIKFRGELKGLLDNILEILKK